MHKAAAEGWKKTEIARRRNSPQVSAEPWSTVDNGDRFTLHLPSPSYPATVHYARTSFARNHPVPVSLLLRNVAFRDAKTGRNYDRGDRRRTYHHRHRHPVFHRCLMKPPLSLLKVISFMLMPYATFILRYLAADAFERRQLISCYSKHRKYYARSSVTLNKIIVLY